MTVVAGIEETDATELVRLAAQEARYRDAELIVVTGFSTDNGMGAPAARPVATLRTPDDSEAVAAALLEREVTAALGEDDFGGVDLVAVAGPGIGEAAQRGFRSFLRVALQQSGAGQDPVR